LRYNRIIHLHTLFEEFDLTLRSTKNYCYFKSSGGRLEIFFQQKVCDFLAAGAAIACSKRSISGLPAVKQFLSYMNMCKTSKVTAILQLITPDHYYRTPRKGMFSSLFQLFAAKRRESHRLSIKNGFQVILRKT
jgi:hypothetical protein